MKLWLLWRTNVGKSTLFNKLLGTHRAIVTDIAGTTRELLIDTTEFNGRHFEIIDSPGLESLEEEIPFLEHIIAMSDLLIFVVDWKEDPGHDDFRIQKMIIDAWMQDKTLLVVNKLDGKVFTDEVYTLLAERYSLWFSHVLPTSAMQAEGILDLRDTITEVLPEDEAEPEDDDQDRIPLAIIWKPNAGKSTLLNTMTGEWIATVSDVAGTTLDYLKAPMSFQWTDFMVYDTAWIRKKWKTVGLEKIAYEKTKSMLYYAQPMVVFIMDLEEGFTKRDASLLWEIDQMWLGVVLAFNKIDLFSKDETERRIQNILNKNTFIQKMPRVSLSAKEAIWIDKVMKEIIDVHKRRTSRIPTWPLNKALTKARLTSPPRFPKNNICKWKYITQVEDSPPTFMLSVNNVEYANFSFKQRIKNVLNKEFWLEWVPIRLRFNSKVDTNPYLDQ